MTFESAFDKQEYVRFLKNLLNEYEDEGAQKQSGCADS